MGKEFTFCRICPSDLLQQFHNGLILFLLRCCDLRNILMIAAQTGTGLVKCFIRNTAAADINFAQGRVIPGIDNLGASGS